MLTGGEVTTGAGAGVVVGVLVLGLGVLVPVGCGEKDDGQHHVFIPREDGP